MSSPSVANPQIHYVIELQDSGVDVRLVLNDIEIARGTQAESKMSQQKVNGWLTFGPNELVLQAGLSDPTQTKVPLDLKCLLFRGPHGRQPEESEALARYAERDKARLPAGAMQVVWSTKFASDPYYGPWRWENGLPVALDPSTFLGASMVIGSVIASLNSHNTNELVRLFRVHIDENSRALGTKVERIEAQLAGWCTSWTTSPPRQVVPEEYSMVVEGSQRLLRIDRKDGKPVFTANPDTPGSGPLRIYLAKLAEGLTIVR